MNMRACADIVYQNFKKSTPNPKIAEIILQAFEDSGKEGTFQELYYLMNYVPKDTYKQIQKEFEEQNLPFDVFMNYLIQDDIKHQREAEDLEEIEQLNSEENEKEEGIQ